MAYSLKNDESLLTEEQLSKTCFNVRSKSYFSEDTEFTFGEDTKLIDKVSNGNHYLKFGDILKNEKETTISASMFLRTPFEEDDRKPLEGITTLQDEILKCVKSSNPGHALWGLLKGKKIKVVKLVNALDRPFGETSKIEMPFSIFDYA